MSPLLTACFLTLIVMALIWLVCVARLERLLRARHPEVYAEYELENLWPRRLTDWIGTFDNWQGVKGLFRFLFRHGDRGLNDAAVTRLGSFMRIFPLLYLVVLGTLLYAFVTEAPTRPAGHRPTAEQRASPADAKRNQAFTLHRQERLAEAITTYDELLDTSAHDAELLYWRGVAHWHLSREAPSHEEQALQDFLAAIEAGADNFEAYQYADRILSRYRRWDEILPLWDRYIERHPDAAEAWYERGGTHHRKGNRAASRADVKKACELGHAEACSRAKRLGLS